MKSKRKINAVLKTVKHDQWQNEEDEAYFIENRVAFVFTVKSGKKIGYRVDNTICLTKECLEELRVNKMKRFKRASIIEHKTSVKSKLDKIMSGNRTGLPGHRGYFTITNLEPGVLLNGEVITNA